MSKATALRRPERRRAVLTSAGSEKIAGISTSVILVLFFLSVMMPIEPSIGPIRMPPYSALQIILFIPLLIRFRADPGNRLVALDFFMALYVLWIAVAIYYHHGTTRAVYIVNQTVTVFGGYLIGRVMIRNAADYRKFFGYFFWGLVIFLPFAVFELLTQQMLVNDLFQSFTPVHPRAGQPPRLGLHRVQGFTEHSIVFGLYCSLGVANFFYIYRDELAKRLTRTGLAAFMTFISLSSAPNIALGIQILMIVWDRTLKIFAYRWHVLIITVVTIVAFIQGIFENGLVGLVIENLAFDPTTGWGRTEIFHYGRLEIIRHPIFGIGLNEWVRPWWRKPSVDNFWLLTGMRFGLPALLALSIGLALHAIQIIRQKQLSEDAASYRRGYLVAGTGLIFVLATVALWGSVQVMVMTYIGAGAWFYVEKGSQTQSRSRRHAVSAAGAVPARATRSYRRGSPGADPIRTERIGDDRPPLRQERYLPQKERMPK